MFAILENEMTTLKQQFSKDIFCPVKCTGKIIMFFDTEKQTLDKMKELFKHDDWVSKKDYTTIVRAGARSAVVTAPESCGLYMCYSIVEIKKGMYFDNSTFNEV